VKDEPVTFTGHHAQNSTPVASFAPGTLFALTPIVRTIWLILLASAALMAHAQQPPGRYFEPYPATRLSVDTPVTGQPDRGRVLIHADPKVERLMEHYGSTKHARQGYRVQIYLGSDRKAAEDIKRAFLQKNPDTPAYLSWLAPNWRLRVGDLRTRLEAERMLRDLKPIYPGSYIVPDEIEMPPLVGAR